MPFKKFVFAMSLLCNFFSFTSHAQTGVSYQVTRPREIKVMQYNVENLFNAVHNQGKNDYQYLPANDAQKENCKKRSRDEKDLKYCLETDYTNQKIGLRFQNIASVLRMQGTLPEILTIQEVESEDIVKALAQYLGYDGYVFFDGPDFRGIDPAILYSKKKLSLYKWDSVPVILDAGRHTRDILRATFTLKESQNNEMLTVMVNHWPSQGSSGDDRMKASKTLAAMTAEVTRYFGIEKAHNIAIGDFNTLDNEPNNPIYGPIVNLRSPLGYVDLHGLFDSMNFEVKKFMPLASTYYPTDNVWNRLDKILLSRNFFDGRGLEAEIETFRIVSEPIMTTVYRATNVPGIPFRFDFRGDSTANIGFSDHFPLVFKFKY